MKIFKKEKIEYAKKFVAAFILSFMVWGIAALPALTNAAGCPAAGTAATLSGASQADFGTSLSVTPKVSADLTGCNYFFSGQFSQINSDGSIGNTQSNSFIAGKDGQAIPIAISGDFFSAAAGSTAPQKFRIAIEYSDSATVQTFATATLDITVNYPNALPSNSNGTGTSTTGTATTGTTNDNTLPPSSNGSGNTLPPNSNGTGVTNNANGNNPQCNFDSAIVSNQDTLCNPLPQKNLGQIVIHLVSVFTQAIVIVAVGIIVFAGFRMVISAGNEEALKTARATATWAVAGLAVALLAYSVVAIIQNAAQNGKLK